MCIRDSLNTAFEGSDIWHDTSYLGLGLGFEGQVHDLELEGEVLDLGLEDQVHNLELEGQVLDLGLDGQVHNLELEGQVLGLVRGLDNAYLTHDTGNCVVANRRFDKLTRGCV